MAWLKNTGLKGIIYPQLLPGNVAEVFSPTVHEHEAFSSRYQMIVRRLSLSLLIIFAAAAIQATGAAPDRPIIPGFERFHADGSGSAQAGELLLGELNCTSCHKTDAKVTTAKQAPILDGVTGRAKADFLRQFIADPHGTKPGTTMPSLFVGVPDDERKAQVESIVHYLASLGPKEPAQEFPAIGAAARGEALFHSVGCAACHNPRKDGAPQIASSVPLPNFMDKYTLPSLTQFLMDPLHVRPSGRMPSLNLSGPEARDIASYLLKGLPEVAIVRYSYFEGSWQSLPDFGKLQPKETGGTDRIDETLKKRGDQFGLRFEGFIRIDKEGDYTFHLGSDDGSRMLIGGKVVIDHNGVHGFSSKSARIRLSAGLHPVIVDFFEQGGGEKLQVEYEGPGISRRSIAQAMTSAKEDPKQESLAIKVDPTLVEIGRKLFASVGCASCHQLKENGKPVVGQLATKPLAEIDAAKGCLSANPGKGIPDFHLGAKQRTSLAATVKSRENVNAPKAQVDLVMKSLNCYACHQRDGKGGVEASRDVFFATTMKEMGDEGRLPPTLDGVGAKLTKKWLDRMFAVGANDRPYMLTRMPKFDSANAGQLTGHFQKLDTIEPVAKPKINAPITAVKAAGWQMTGAKGFSCIKCHPFGPYKAEGIQALDLTLMSQRLNEDWFKRYMRDPQAFRRGTRMPSSWLAEESLLPDILDGKSHTQIHAVWSYLTDGNKARTPMGLVMNSMELVPFNEAIIYRNFIQGAGTRAIAVGYPEGRHLAFDANQIRLALLWQGSFIDAKRHWTGRGQGFQGPAGSNLLKLPDGVPLANLEDEQTPWPNQAAREIGYRFRGYRLTPDQRPTFLYSYGDLKVEDFPNAVASETSTAIQRTITIKSEKGVKGLWFRAIVAGKIEEVEVGKYRVDDTWTMEVKDAAPSIRKQGNQFELLVPVVFQEGTAKISLEYDW